jgi:hypothetical protein
MIIYVLYMNVLYLYYVLNLIIMYDMEKNWEKNKEKFQLKN